MENAFIIAAFCAALVVLEAAIRHIQRWRVRRRYRSRVYKGTRQHGPR